MYKEVSNSQIEIEVKESYKPPVIESGLTVLPFTNLSDRDFELLAYLLLKEELNDNPNPDFSSISLMQGVSERGRDCVLYKNNIASGLVQCKKEKGRISRPKTIKEIIKFLLFAKLDKRLMPDAESFEYKYYVADDLAETTLSLFQSHPHEIQIEIDSGKFHDYVIQVVNEYESFATLRKNPPSNEISEQFKKIKITYSNAVDLTSRIYNKASLLQQFFKVITVISNDTAEEIIRKTFDEYGVKYLTDEALIELQERIGKISTQNRFSLGFVDFFGFSNDFFGYLKGEALIEVIQQAMSVKTLLDRYTIEFTRQKINHYIIKYITNGPFQKGLIHPYSIQIASPYLFQRLSSFYFKKSALNIILPQKTIISNHPKDQVLAFIKKDLLKVSEKIMSNDFSHLTGSPDEIELKKELYNEFHRGASSIQDLENIMDNDLLILMPIFDSIEESLKALITPETTVIIKDTSFIGNPDLMKNLASTLRGIC